MERVKQIAPPKMKPLGDCVLIKEEPFIPYNEHIGLSKIIVPDRFSHGPKDRNPWGKILAVGKNCTEVNAKERVTWGKFAGQRYEYGKEILVLVLEKDILAKEVK